MRFIRFCLISCIVVIAAAAAFAQSGYPQPDDNYVNDFAGILAGDAETYIRTQLQTVEERDQIEMSVVTIDTIGDYAMSARTFEAFATGLFNAWGIGDAARGDGILLLVAIEDRDVRVELGEAYDLANNTDAQDILDENILPAFRRGDYQVGIVNGVRALISEFTGVLPPLPPSSVTRSQPTQSFSQQTADEEQDEDGSPLVVLGLVILGGLVLIGLFSIFGSNEAVSEGWAGDPDGNADWDDDGSDDDQRRASNSPRSSWSSSSSRRSSPSTRSSSSSSRRSSFGGGRSKGGGASGKW